MRRLAARARHRRAPSQDCPPNGLGSDYNGELLKLASKHFDIFVTVDRNLAFQQSLVVLPIPVVVPHAKANRLADLKPLVPDLLAKIDGFRPGTVYFIGGARLASKEPLKISRIRCGVTGSRVTAPGIPIAASIALAIAAPTALTPASPAPLSPSALSGLGASSVMTTWSAGISRAVGIV